MKQQQRQLMMMLLAYAAQRDIDQERLCALSGIDGQRLHSGKETKTGQAQINRLWENAVRLSGDELFGLHFGSSLQLAALGVVGAVIQTSATVGEAVCIAAGMAPLLTALLTMDTEQAAKQFMVHFRPVSGVDTDSLAFRQTLDFFMAFTVRELDGLLFTRVKPMSLRMGHTLTDTGAYEQALRCRPAVRKGSYSLGFSPSLWEEKIITADYELQAVHLQKVQTLLAQKADRRPIRSKSICFSYG